MSFSRRDFLLSSAAATAAMALPGSSTAARQSGWFQISLAQWSLHRAIRAGKLDHLDFAKVTREEFDIDGIEYVNQFFMDKAKDEKYLAEMKKRASDHGVTSILIMCDREGRLGDPDEKKRTEAVENHYKWADAAKFLGCHSIRVNAASAGSYEEQVKLAADGLSRLTEYASGLGLNVLVENHGGLSSNGAWLAEVMRTVNGGEPAQVSSYWKNAVAAYKSHGFSNAYGDSDFHCGTLPDFGNFRVSKDEEYDRYKGVKELMPFAKAVSAKSHAFGPDGNDTNTDFFKMMQIVRNAGYTGWVGIEYEGSQLDEYAGIKATKTLLERVAEQIA